MLKARVHAMAGKARIFLNSATFWYRMNEAGQGS
jgi:hypothetical protein